MNFLNFFWFFLDGDKSSSQIIEEKKQPVQQVQQYKTEEATCEGVEEINEQKFEEFFD